MSLDTIRESFRVPLECRLLREAPEDAELLAIALHGYGQTAETMLGLTRKLLGGRIAIVSVEAPHPQYLAADFSDDRIGFHWGVRTRWEEAVRLHHAVVERVLESCGFAPARRFLIGFSQPVGLNYRFVAAHPGAVGGVIGLCGGVPKAWAEPGFPVDAALLHISRSEDEYFPPETIAPYERWLKAHAADAEFHLLPGRHRFPSRAGEIVGPWLRRVFRSDLQIPESCANI
jgi:predicted esterase